MKTLGRYICLVLLGLFVVACSSSEQASDSESSVNGSVEGVWIDVRSEAAYDKQHLDGAMNIAYANIVDGVSQAGLNKDEEISLYCGTGYFAGKAQEALEEAGYTNVVNRGGVKDVLGL